jgi:hypothetical protein
MEEGGWSRGSYHFGGLPLARPGCVVYLFVSSSGSSPFFVVMNGGSAIKRDLELYAPSVHARPVFSYTAVTVFVSFSLFRNKLFGGFRFKKKKKHLHRL